LFQDPRHKWAQVKKLQRAAAGRARLGRMATTSLGHQTNEQMQQFNISPPASSVFASVSLFLRGQQIRRNELPETKGVSVFFK
jgi:hypothetical protein